MYAAAAERLDTRRLDDVEVSGRQFRAMRVERLMRIGPDGPDGLRPSDPDPQSPTSRPTQLSREQVDVPGEDEDPSAGLDEDTQRLAQLFHGRRTPECAPERAERPRRDRQSDVDAAASAWREQKACRTFVKC